MQQWLLEKMQTSKEKLQLINFKNKILSKMEDCCLLGIHELYGIHVINSGTYFDQK